MIKKQSRSEVRVKKHMKVRNRFSGTAERPRLAVFRSNNHMYAQVIDDVTGKTICALSTLGPDFKKTGKTGATVEGAAELGKLIGKKAQKKGVTEVVFDRGGNLYHGRIQAVADGAREAGLKF